MSQSSYHLSLNSFFSTVHCAQIAPKVTKLNPAEHIWDMLLQEIPIMDVQWQQMCYVIMSIRKKVSGEFFLHFVESVPKRVFYSEGKQVLNPGMSGKVVKK